MASLPGLETSRSDSDERALPVGVRGGVSSRSALCFASVETTPKWEKKGMKWSKKKLRNCYAKYETDHRGYTRSDLLVLITIYPIIVNNFSFIKCIDT